MRLIGLLLGALLLSATPALAQRCPIGQPQPVGGCGITDLAVGGAITDSTAFFVCQNPSGCSATSPVVLANQNSAGALATYMQTKISGTLSGMTAGQIPIAASATTVTSSQTLSQLMDAALGSAPGSLAYRGASTWTALAPGTNGQLLALATGLPAWQTFSPGGGTVNSGTGPQIAQYPGGTSTTVAGVTVSGDCSMAAGGAITCTKLNGVSPGAGFTFASPLPAANGGTGVASPTLYGTLVGQGAAAVHSIAPGTLGFVLTSNGVAADPSFQAPAGGGSFANPTATIGTAAVNGVATTAMRSDAAPAIPQCSAGTFGACKPDGSTITATAGVLTAVGGTANNTIPVFPTAGGPTTYTATAAGYTAVSSTLVCVAFTTTNVANPTLNIQGAGAKPLKILSTGALLSPAGGELPTVGATCLDYDGTNYVMTTYPTPGPPIAITDTVTAQKWSSGQVYNILTGAQTITLPAAGTTLPTGGGITITTVGVTAQLCAVGSDVINNGQVGGGSAGGCVTIPADTTTLVQTSGTAGATAFNAPLGPVQYFFLTWAEGLNLSTNARYVSRFSTPKVIYGIKCNVQAAAGTASTLHIFSTPSGTAPGIGTALDTTGCNANTASNTEQDMGVASGGLGTTVAGYTIWAVFSGSGTSGNGGYTIAYR